MEGSAKVQERWSVRKTSRAIRMFTKILKQYGGWSDAMVDFEREYGERHKVPFTRDIVQERKAESELLLARLMEPPSKELTEDQTDDREQAIRYARASVQSWSALLTGPLADAEQIDRPAVPSADEKYIAVLPQAFEEAEEEITSFLGVVCMTNEEVAMARKTGNPDDEFKKRGEELLDTMPLEEAMDVLIDAGEVIAESISKRRDRLGNLRKRFGGSPSRLVEEVETTSSTATDSSSGSSTPSPAEDGPSTTSSMDSPTTTLEVSSTS